MFLSTAPSPLPMVAAGARPREPLGLPKLLGKGSPPVVASAGRSTLRGVPGDRGHASTNAGRAKAARQHTGLRPKHSADLVWVWIASMSS